MDLTDSIAPRSDQINADDLMSGPRTVTIEEVSKGSAEQPVNVYLAEYGRARPYRPSKSMRRVMVSAWGPSAAEYVGRRMTLYRDPTIKFGGQEVGGIRISHLSHIDGPLTLALTVTRGKREKCVIQPLAGTSQPDRISKAVSAFEQIGVNLPRLEAALGPDHGAWDMEALMASYKSITSGSATADDLFPDAPAEDDQ